MKICGITNLADAECAAGLGADALGFVLYPRSVRYVGVDVLADFFGDIPAGVKRVGLFVDEAPETVTAALATLSFELLQFHGRETPAYCESFGVPYIKALRATSRDDIAANARQYQSASAILVDTDAGAQFGGTGVSFDWQMLPALEQPLMLAGGITVDNVGFAIAEASPFAVDVSGGVEARSGKKDPAKLAGLFAAVRAADASVSRLAI